MVTRVVNLTAGQFATVAYEECLRRLSWETVGRIGAIEPDGSVSVYPVNYVFHENTVLFRTTPRRGAVLTRGDVTFEVDQIDDVHGAGWSVIARGPVTLIDDSPLGAAPISWAPDGRTLTARLTPHEVSGREIFVPRRSHS